MFASILSFLGRTLLSPGGFSPDGPERPYSIEPAPAPIAVFTGIGASTLNGFGFEDFAYSPSDTGFLEESPMQGVSYSGNGFSTPGFTPPSIDYGQLLRVISGGVIGGGGNGAMVPAVTVLGEDSGGAVPVALSGAPMVGRLPQIVAAAIARLRATLGGPFTMTIGAITAYGRRVWQQVTDWVRRNPGTSAIAILTGLGLTVEEAAHFLAWGATSKRKRRGRGISFRDLRTAKRTMRKIIGMSNSMRELCSAGAFRPRYRHHHHHRRP